MGMYAALVDSLVTVITNGVEVRLYSPLRGISFERSLLYSIKREELASERSVAILRKFLSRSSLTSGQVHQHLNERETELRKAYAEIDELKERSDEASQNLNAEIADLENQLDEFQIKIDGKRKELSELDDKRRSDEEAVWQRLDIKPSSQPDRHGQPQHRVARAIGHFRERGEPVRPAGPANSVYRLRMGDYRVLFDVRGDIILIQKVGHRKDVYD